VADRLIASDDQQGMGAARSLHASASLDRTIGPADRVIGSRTQAIGSAILAIASPNQPARSTARNSL
jgi:hypothetical protein